MSLSSPNVVIKNTHGSIESISTQQQAILLVSILVVALCGIAYELIIGTVSSYLLGNSVYQFSITIGFFMFSMGFGSWLSKFINNNLIENFIWVEVIISLVGGICSLILFISFPLVHALYSLVMYLLIFIIGSLVGLEIPILTRILSARKDAKHSIANVLSLDYIGALIGSIMFPLLLLPHLGLIRSSFAVGMINILTAIVNVYIFRKSIKNIKLLKVVTFSILLGLIIFTIIGTRITSFAEQHLYFDQIIFSKQTKYQKITVTRSNQHSDYRLFIDGHIQFSSKDEYRYHESLVHPIMSLPGSIKNILILGGGDGMAAREILKYPEVETIDLVDIDPEITRISKEFPVLANLNNESLSNKKVNIFNQDAFVFINRAGKKYDRVIIDMPDPHNEAINKLYSREFYQMIKFRMKQNAFIVSQSSSPFFARTAFWCIEKTLNHVFDNTKSYHVTIPAFGVWGFNLASVSGPISPEFSVDVPTKFLTSDLMQAAQIFGKDTSQVDTPVNSIMEPKLYLLYVKELSL